MSSASGLDNASEVTMESIEVAESMFVIKVASGLTTPSIDSEFDDCT